MRRLFLYANQAVTFGAAAIIIVIASLLYVQTAAATASNPKMFISGDNTFYIYAKGGESINVSFIREGLQAPGNMKLEDVATSLSGPGLEQKTCALPKTTAVGQGCKYDAVIAPQTGIYSIQFKLPDTALSYEQVSPAVKWGLSLYSWNIIVKDGAVEKTGRVWSELYAIRQPDPAEYLANLSYYYMSEGGYLYKASYKGYNGQISTLSADAVGIRKGTTCQSAYQSIQVTSTEMSPSFGACGGSYKLFFEQPAGDLPPAAKRADGKSDWVSPSISRPHVSELAFTSDKNGSVQSGKITFKLKNFVGQYKLRIDTNADGSYDGRDDVTLARALKKQSSDTQSVTFNGIDGQSQPIATTQPIRIKIEVDKVAEIHLVSADVEGRVGGIELTRLSGDNAPTTRMCWNDTELSLVGDSGLQTKEPDGRNCPESTKTPHGWPYATGSWGDGKYIDDWAYASARTEGTNEIRYPDQVDAAAETKRMGSFVVIAVVVGGLIFVVLLIGIIVMLKRRKDHAARIRASQQMALPSNPTQYPGSGQQPPTA